MKMALENTDLSEVDVVVMHAPGTIKATLQNIKQLKVLVQACLDY
jgi:hypothetical protein